MKLQDKLINKYGVDKVLHLLAGFGIQAIIVSIATMLYGHMGYLCGSFIALFIVYAVSIFKEKYLDDTTDMKDVDWAMFGSAIAFAINMLAFMSVVIYKIYL